MLLSTWIIIFYITLHPSFIRYFFLEFNPNLTDSSPVRTLYILHFIKIIKTVSETQIYKQDLLVYRYEIDYRDFNITFQLWYHRIWQTLKTTFDFRMFTEFHFLMFNLSSLILSVWFIVPYFFLKSYMTDVNLDGGEMMICIIGVASSIGIVSTFICVLLAFMQPCPRIRQLSQ